MINLRYHIVSLVAVFLAIGLGVIVGTTVVDQGIVRALEREQAALQDRTRSLADDNDALRRELDLWGRYGSSVLPQLMRDRLTGKQIVLVIQEGVPADLVRAVDKAIDQAGGRDGGRVRLTDKWRLDSQTAREQLALSLGTSDTDADALYGEAGARIGQRLSSPADATADDDLLRSLERAGFLGLDDLPNGAFPAPGALGVFIVSGRESSPPPLDPFALPMLRGIRDGMPFAVAEPLRTASSIVERVRDERDLTFAVATVDHADTPIGQFALVAALQDVGARVQAPHYGVRDHADGIAPGVSGTAS